MTPKKYFGEDKEMVAKKGSLGIESDWMTLCEFELVGRQFLVVDAGFVPSADDGVLISTRCGKYKIQIKGIDFSGDRRISRLRTVLIGENPKLGEQIGKTWTDTGMTGVVDYETFVKAWGDDDDASYDKLQEKMEAVENFGVVLFDKTAKALMPVVSSGFGDGSFPVFNLLADGEVVGFEVEFISSDTKYPFELSQPVPDAKSGSNDLAEWLKVLAIKGEHVHANSLGLMYAQGDQVPQNFARARGWYRYAVKIGSVNAAYRLGLLYFSGQGGAKDYEKARRFYKIAANAGNAAAINDLGSMYQNGQGVERDFQKATELFQVAAIKGSAAAQFNLALAFEHGRGVTKDLALAAKWYEDSAKQGFAKAICNLGHLYLHGKGVSEDLSKAFELFTKAANAGHVIATINLGYCYAEGKGVEKNPMRAVALYMMVLDKHPMAANNLAEHFEKGLGAKKDLKLAVKYYQKAVDAGLPLAQYNLGRLYENGIGVSQNLDEAKKLYELAAKQANPEAIQALGRLQ